MFDNTESSVSSVKTSESKTSSKVSKQSSNLSLHVKQTAAEVAATQEVIKMMNAQLQQEEEIQRLEMEEQMLTAEVKGIEAESTIKRAQIEGESARKRAQIEAESARRRAQSISESAAKRMKLEGKRKEVERLEELIRHNAAQARLQVYSEGEHSNEEKPLLAPFPQQSQEAYSSQPRVLVSLHPPLTLNALSDPFFPSRLAPLSPNSPCSTSTACSSSCESSSNPY